MQNLQPALVLKIFSFLGICSVPSMCLGFNLIVSIICCCFLIATPNVSSGSSSTEILLCFFSLSSLLPPVSALFHPEHMGSPLSAWSSVSWPFVAGCCSQVSPCIHDQPGEGMWKSQVVLGRCLVNVACGSWGKKWHFCCVVAKHELQAAEHSCILLLASSLHLLEAGVSCDGWLVFPDLFHFVSRWAFLPKQTAPAVNTPVSILTVMRTSMPSSTVSCHDLFCILLSVRPSCLYSLAELGA